MLEETKIPFTFLSLEDAYGEGTYSVNNDGSGEDYACVRTGGIWEICTFTFCYKNKIAGSLGGAAVWRLPLAQGAILETWDQVPHRAPGAWSLLLPLPMSLPLSLSLSLSLS